ncbi:SDR family NAD(P)-dependent oxidoreductase [Parasphingorhabdus sp. DH2-15]|uniref:SDR family NAD(P)-dependent oxidoreductase n=1 Tax=Parasphingorhabdus sp. DH2-15 TaxID=3444112 RepID=UPI003F689787
MSNTGNSLLIFGMGYTAGYLADILRGQGWKVTGTRRSGDAHNLAFADRESVLAAIDSATHILSSVPPDRDTGADPVLDNYGAAIAKAKLAWSGYISATGVYGDTKGAWVDESAPIGGGRRTARAEADENWQKLRSDMRVFRLPGIYGPGRSVFERLQKGVARRIDMPGQVFSRCHVADIASGIIAGFTGPAGAYNLSDDLPCAQNLVLEYACALSGAPLPPLQTVEQAELSPMARKFYSENRRVANGKAKRLLNWQPQYPTYKQGLEAIWKAA